MIDLPADQLLLVQRIVARHVPGHEVRAFGSRVAGGAKPWSDLDLAVVADEPLSLDTLAWLKDDLRESDLPIKVDVVEWRDLPDALRHAIGASWERLPTEA